MALLNSNLVRIPCVVKVTTAVTYLLMKRPTFIKLKRTKIQTCKLRQILNKTM